MVVVKLQYYPQHYLDTPLDYATPSGVDIEIIDDQQQIVAEGTTNGSGIYDIDWTGSSSQHTLIGSKALDNSYVDVNGEVLSHIFYFTPSKFRTHNWSWITDASNAYHHANLIHDYIVGSPFYCTDMNYQMDVELNCAIGTPLSDGIDIYFPDFGYFAQSSDMVYHEYTHCIVYHLYSQDFIGIEDWYGDESWAMDEAFPDYYAASINDDSEIGENAIPSSRELDNNLTMNDYDDLDVYGKQYANSLILSGALWDMRESDVGESLADELIYFTLEQNPDDFSETLNDILYEDDNDANISNGTPNIDAILYAFENHLIYPSDPNVPPSAPKNLDVSESPQHHPILNWDENTEPDLQNYKIYRKWTYGSYEHVHTTTNTTWTDEGIYIIGGYTTWTYYVVAVDNSSKVSNPSNTVSVDGLDVEIEITDFDLMLVPSEFSLNQNFPNPFNPVTTIQFGLPEDNNVRLVVYNIQGQVVANLIDGFLNAGYHTVGFNAFNLPSGIYFYKITASDFVDLKRMVLLK